MKHKMFTRINTGGFWNFNVYICRYLGLTACGVPNHWKCTAGRVRPFQFQIGKCRGQRCAAFSLGKRWYGKLFGSIAR